MPAHAPNGPGGYFSVPPKQAPKPRPKQPDATPQVVPTPFRPCDRCGFAHDGCPIARAKHQVEVIGGTLFFCNHHFTEHALFFIANKCRVVRV